MPANNVKQIKIWKSAHKWLEHISDEFKAEGNSSASMTSLASQAILAIPEPIPNGNKLIPSPCGEKIVEESNGNN